MPRLAFLLNTDLERGFTVVQVAGKQDWLKPLVWPHPGPNDCPYPLLFEPVSKHFSLVKVKESETVTLTLHFVQPQEYIEYFED